MRQALNYLGGLAQLHTMATPDAVRALWRQGMATLAALASEQQPVPLEGLSPEDLLASVKVALHDGLVDDLAWLSPEAAAVAVFELASALPPSHEKRELGRRVLATLRTSDAATFVALATSLALGSRRALAGDLVRARVALALRLPAGMGTRSDALALALISRRELGRDWLSLPSTGSLPSRRLAARLLERAAREAARRAAEGDDTGAQVFGTRAVKAAWDRLLGDRESLVWRHVATARGLLANALPACARELEAELSPELSPTEWRRAAASLAASIAVTPETALDRSRALLASTICERDRGVPGCMLFGLPFAADVEPDAVDALLVEIVRVGELHAAESLVELRRKRFEGEIGERAAAIARGQLQALASDASDDCDDGMVALLGALQDELLPTTTTASYALRDRISDALHSSARDDAATVVHNAESVLETAMAAVDRLERTRATDRAGRVEIFGALRDLDTSLLETSALRDLLLIDGDQRARQRLTRLDAIFDRLTRYLLSAEAQPLAANDAREHPTLRQRRMRTLLHLIDADGSIPEANGALRARRLETARVLLTRVRDDAPTHLRRATCAALARTCDALLREEVCELSDVLVAISSSVQSERDLEVLAEASMAPELESAMRAYTTAVRAAAGADTIDDARDCPDALVALAQALPTASSARVEALRAGLLELGRALQQVARARSLEELGGSADTAPLSRLAAGAERVAQLVSGARYRLGLAATVSPPALGDALRTLAAAVERAQRGATDGLADAIGNATALAHDELPAAIAEPAALLLPVVLTLPVDAPRGAPRESLPITEHLAPWLPPSRILGGFYVKRTIGTGAVGTVFVACRVEQRHDETAEVFALKVPEYSGSAAHTLSEAEFMRLFREEAGALLALPENPNLARFVTFDAGARPKPILVMELVEGPSLESVLDESHLELADALALLDGIASGLAAMHSVGVGHLDVKPSNIILRYAEEPEPAMLTHAPRPAPVLVDFGLAGRTIRPGCGTVYYGAPEVWKPELAGPSPDPTAVDVYAFACLAFEMLTGEALFDADTPIAVVTAHLGHDGGPAALRAWAGDATLAPLASLLCGALRRDPRQRLRIPELRQHLRALAPSLASRPWPLAVPGTGRAAR